MGALRRGARAVLRYYIPLYVLAVIVQIFLAGEGIFGIKAGPKLDDQKTLDPHRAFGFILADFGSIILLILALLAWYDDRRLRWVSIALPFLLFIQGILGGAGRWAGAFHPLNAFLILALLGWMTHVLWRGDRVSASEAESVSSA
ncbi:MAG TPA: DUF6220 domain-containing protein [Gaiellaceae bacterium]|nr:DUF6220 domain-containing protein [Gaiellaceae bacterium]